MSGPVRPPLKTQLDNGTSSNRPVSTLAFANTDFTLTNSGTKTTIAIAHVVGAAWLALENIGIPAILIDNRRWKKVILGKGNASKTDIKDFAVDKWGDRFPEQDYADAACIALWNKRRLDNG